MVIVANSQAMADPADDGCPRTGARNIGKRGCLFLFPPLLWQFRKQKIQRLMQAPLNCTTTTRTGPTNIPLHHLDVILSRKYNQRKKKGGNMPTIAPHPLSWSALSQWRRNVNQYLLYRLGYVSRSPALHRGIELHTYIADVLAGREAADPATEPLIEYISQRPLVGIETALSATVRSAPIYGRTDLIWATPEGLVIGDIKTGKPYPQHKEQLHFYALLFLGHDLPLSSLECLYWRAGDLKTAQYDIDESVLSALRLEIEEAYYAISSQSIPDEIVIPVHGTTFTGHDLDVPHGSHVDLVPEWVRRDDGEQIWGLRVYYQDEPIGWIPDSLKHRILARYATVFASRQTNDRRNGYVRLLVDSSEIDWRGIAA